MGGNAGWPGTGSGGGSAGSAGIAGGGGSAGSGAAAGSAGHGASTGGAPPVRVGLIAQSIVLGGSLNITGGKKDDDWREEIHDAEPMHSLAIGYGTKNPSPVEGTHWWKAFWGKGWSLRSGKVRTELKRPNDRILDAGSEYWIGLAFFIPDTPEAKALANTDKQNNHCFQFHYVADQGTSGMNMLKGRYKFSFGTKPEVDLGAVVFGLWNKMVIHADLQTNNTGFVEAWLNPTVVNNMPVGAPDYEYRNTPTSPPSGLNVKLGIYRHHAVLPEHDIQYLYDSVRIGNASSNFISVYPGTP